LIIGFNTFLPPGYSLEPTNNPNDPVRVTTPRGTHYIPHQPPPQPPYQSFRPNFQRTETAPSREVREFSAPHQNSQPTTATPSTQPGFSQITGASNIISSMNPAPANSESRRSDGNSRQRGPMEFNHAINYVNKIKTRFANQPETYRYFLEILQTYQKDEKPISEVTQI
jgi:paired amphipathic helix protein Sin3a